MKVMNVFVFGRPASPRKCGRRVEPAGPKNTLFGGSYNGVRVRKSIETRKLKAEFLQWDWLDTRTYIYTYTYIYIERERETERDR